MMRQLGRVISTRCVSRRKVFVTQINVRGLSSAPNANIEDFQQYVKSSDFKRISKDAVIDLIASDNLRVTSELEVVEGVMKWVGFDRGRRNLHLTELLSLVRYPYTQRTSKDQYSAYIRQEYPELDALVAKEDLYRKLSFPGKLAHVRETGIKPRKYSEVLVALPEYKTDRSEVGTDSLQYFDPRVGQMLNSGHDSAYWKFDRGQYTILQFLSNGIGALAVDGNAGLWLLDHYGNASRVSSPVGDEDKPTDATVLSKNIIQIEDCLYFLQFQPKTLKLSGISEYNIVTGEWKSIQAPMKDYACVSVTAANGKMYTTSGARPFLLAYDPRCDEWQTVVDERPKQLLDSVTLSAVGPYLYILSLEFWPSQTDGQIFSYDTETGKRGVVFRDVLPATASGNKRNTLAASMCDLNSQLIIPEVSHHANTNSAETTHSFISAFHSYDPVHRKRVIFHDIPQRYDNREVTFAKCWKFCVGD